MAGSVATDPSCTALHPSAFSHPDSRAALEDRGEVTTATQRLHAGIVSVNIGVASDPSGPFGGVKESGLGREGSHEGLAGFLENYLRATAAVASDVTLGAGDALAPSAGHAVALDAGHAVAPAAAASTTVSPGQGLHRCP